MRKLKTILSLLLTTVLIGVMAILPQIAAVLLDRMTIGKSDTAPMQTVQLEFRSAGQTERDGILRKLALQGHMYTMPINAGEASMTEDEVYAAVVGQMERYHAAGIFDGFEPTYNYVEPILGIDPDTMENNNIFWTVTIVNENNPYESLFVHIDDETGKLLYIQYQIYRSFALENIYEYTRFVMDTFTGIYFEQLGLQWDAGSEPILDEGVTDGDVLYRRYTFPCTAYGDIIIEFETTGSGSFWMYFPTE